VWSPVEGGAFSMEHKDIPPRELATVLTTRGVVGQAPQVPAPLHRRLLEMHSRGLPRPLIEGLHVTQISK
jgi:hypothetical protein